MEWDRGCDGAHSRDPLIQRSVWAGRGWVGEPPQGLHKGTVVVSGGIERGKQLERWRVGLVWHVEIDQGRAALSQVQSGFHLIVKNTTFMSLTFSSGSEQDRGASKSAHTPARQRQTCLPRLVVAVRCNDECVGRRDRHHLGIAVMNIRINLARHPKRPVKFGVRVPKEFNRANSHIRASENKGATDVLKGKEPS